MVADHHPREGGEDRREGDCPRSLRRLPDGRGRGPARHVRPHPRHDRRSATTRARTLLTAGSIRTRRATGEVRPCRCKMGRNCAAGAGHGGRGGEFAAAEAIAAPFRLPVGLGSGYPAVNRGRMGRPSGKSELTEIGRRRKWSIFCRSSFASSSDGAKKKLLT